MTTEFNKMRSVASLLRKLSDNEPNYDQAHNQVHVPQIKKRHIVWQLKLHGLLSKHLRNRCGTGPDYLCYPLQTYPPINRNGRAGYNK